MLSVFLTTMSEFRMGYKPRHIHLIHSLDTGTDRQPTEHTAGYIDMYILSFRGAIASLTQLQTPVLLDGTWVRLRCNCGAKTVNPAIQPLEGSGAEGHHNGAENKQSNSALEWDLFEDRIRIPGRSATSTR